MINITTNKKLKFLAYSLLLFTFIGCKKSAEFNAKLNALPQISYAVGSAYRSAYTVGDTMVIIGRLQPKSNLQISIGGVAASIVNVDSIPGMSVNVNQQQLNTFEDRVSIIITAAMAGASREVKVTTGGYTIIGSPIDVYTYGGQGSFNSILKSVQVTQSTLSNSYQFLYAVTGKGDVYYYAPNTENLWRITKDGTTTNLYDLSSLNITAFLAGGVDPQAQNLYFSVQSASGYALYKLNLSNSALTLLNQSTGLNAPYEGAISAVQMIVTGIYPDSKGNLYLGIGAGKGSAPNFVPAAIARFNIADGSIHYIFKGLAQTYPGEPGVDILTGNSLTAIRLSPDEDLLYTMKTVSGFGNIGIQLYDLTVGVQLNDLETSNGTPASPSNYDVISSFSGLQINLLPDDPDNSFGYLPMPGKRLQVLLFQNYMQAASHGSPQWVVFDFVHQRTYAYGLGQFQQGNGQYTFRSTDQLLNYDEAGDLYMTSNGLSYLIMTQPSN